MPEKPNNDAVEKNKLSAKTNSNSSDETKINEKFRQLHDKKILAKALEEYDTLCESINTKSLVL